MQREPKEKKKRISSYEISEIIVVKNIKTRTELLALVRERKLEGKTDFAEFIMNRGSEVVAEVLETAWEMEGAQETIRRGKSRRMRGTL